MRSRISCIAAFRLGAHISRILLRNKCMCFQQCVFDDVIHTMLSPNWEMALIFERERAEN